jgi:hypothetical protein
MKANSSKVSSGAVFFFFVFGSCLSHLVSNYQQFVMARNQFIDTLISLYDLSCAVETSLDAFELLLPSNAICQSPLHS